MTPLTVNNLQNFFDSFVHWLRKPKLLRDLFKILKIPLSSCCSCCGSPFEIPLCCCCCCGSSCSCCGSSQLTNVLDTTSNSSMDATHNTLIVSIFLLFFIELILVVSPGSWCLHLDLDVFSWLILILFTLFWSWSFQMDLDFPLYQIWFLI